MSVVEVLEQKPKELDKESSEVLLKERNMSGKFITTIHFVTRDY